VKLSTRLTILLITITTLVALAVGSFAVVTSSRTQYASLDDSINAVAASGVGHPLTALSDALNLVQQDNLDLTLDVVDSSGKVTELSTSQVPLTRHPTMANIRESLNGIRTASNLPGFRFRSIPVGGGAYLVIAGSTSHIAGLMHQLVVRTILVGLLAALAMGIIARLFMRRDLRTIDRLVSFAKDVAQGDIATSVPPAVGSTDVRELQSALAHMVVSLRQKIEAEQRSSLTMQRFIGDASHELRTPLTVIRGYAELLARTASPDPQQQRALERVQKEVARMDSLVGDLLFLAEVNEVRTHDAAIVDLSELVAANTHDFTMDHSSRDVSAAIAPGVFVAGHRNYIERLIINAFSNIGRHTGAHDPVRVSLEHLGDNVVLKVEDGGPGMPEGTYGVRPEQFQRFDPSRSRTSGGSGLGMSIMADIATSMGGVLTTSKSTLGGLALTFIFPAATPPR